MAFTYPDAATQRAMFAQDLKKVKVTGDYFKEMNPSQLYGLGGSLSLLLEIPPQLVAKLTGFGLNAIKENQNPESVAAGKAMLQRAVSLANATIKATSGKEPVNENNILEYLDPNKHYDLYQISDVARAPNQAKDSMWRENQQYAPSPQVNQVYAESLDKLKSIMPFITNDDISLVNSNKGVAEQYTRDFEQVKGLIDKGYTASTGQELPQGWTGMNDQQIAEMKAGQPAQSSSQSSAGQTTANQVTSSISFKPGLDEGAKQSIQSLIQRKPDPNTWTETDKTNWNWATSSTTSGQTTPTAQSGANGGVSVGQTQGNAPWSSQEARQKLAEKYGADVVAQMGGGLTAQRTGGANAAAYGAAVEGRSIPSVEGMAAYNAAQNPAASQQVSAIQSAIAPAPSTPAYAPTDQVELTSAKGEKMTALGADVSYWQSQGFNPAQQTAAPTTLESLNPLLSKYPTGFQDWFKSWMTKRPEFISGTTPQKLDEEFERWSSSGQPASVPASSPEVAPWTPDLNWAPGLNNDQKRSVTLLLANKPPEQWTDTDKANWDYATQNSPIPGLPQGADSSGAASSGASGVSGQATSDYTSQLSSLEKELLGLMSPGEGENKTQAQLDALNAQMAKVNASKELGLANVSEQPIAQTFLTGQSAALQRQAAAMMGALESQTVPLTSQLAREQAKRAAALDVSKTRYEIESAKKGKPVTLSAGETYYDPNTGKMVTGPAAAKLLTPTEAATLGVPYGTTVEQAAAMGITPARWKASSGGGGSSSGYDF